MIQLVFFLRGWDMFSFFPESLDASLNFADIMARVVVVVAIVVLYGSIHIHIYKIYMYMRW